MRKYTGLAAAAILAAAVAGAPRVCFAEADAAQAYQDGKAAFAAGQFDKARELFVKASETDVKNPEVFLMLGKADYELGKVSEAIAAWSKTVELAPQEPYAARMLKQLRGEGADAEQSVKLVQALVADELYESAVESADRILARTALADEQRVQVMLLKAEALLDENRPREAQAAVREAMVKFPKLVDSGKADVLIARAKVRTGGDATAEGVALLNKVIADHPNTPEASAAQLELLSFELEQSPTQAGVDALAKWIGAHGDDPLADKARRRLISAEFALTDRTTDAGPDSPLAASDRAALDVSATLYKRLVRSESALKLTQEIVAHFDAHYASHRAFAAAAEGMALLVKAAPPGASLSAAMHALARFQIELAMRDAAREVDGGQPAAQLPKAVADALATLAAIDQQFPYDPAWRQQADFAERLRKLGEPLPWPAKVTEAKPPFQWAVAVGLPVVKSNDAQAVDQVTRTIGAIVTDCVRPSQPGSLAVALDVSGRLLAVLGPEQPGWMDAMWQRESLLDAQAVAQFGDNLKAGHAEQNAALSPAQTELIATLVKIVARDAKQIPAAVDRLRSHLQPWVAAGYYSNANDAYAKLAAALPASQQKTVQLAAIDSTVAQALRQQEHLVATGLAVPRKLEPGIEAALKQLYSLQADLPDADPLLMQVRESVENIVAQYKKLEYFDVAEVAIAVKADKAVPAADVFAQFELARLRDEQARRDLDATLKNYNAAEKLALSPVSLAAIDAYEKFITDHPADPLAGNAAEGIFEIARTFERHGAFDVAAEVYRGFVVFAEKNKVLLQAEPGNSSPVERSAFAAAAALDAKARDVLGKSVAARKSTDAPPAKLSDEAAAALLAYRDFIKAHPQSPLIGSAIQRVMAVALEYARADAWDVAEGIYASLLDGGPVVKDPERIAFARGMCQVGKVMPDHAKEVLGALTAGRFASPGAHEPAEALATAEELERSKAAELDKSKLALPVTQPAASAPTGATVAAKPLESNAPAQPPVDAAAQLQLEMPQARADGEVLAAISRQEARRAQMVANLRDNFGAAGRQSGQGQVGGGGGAGPMPQDLKQQAQQAIAPLPVVSPEELARQQAALDAAYKIFAGILAKYPQSVTAAQARGEILVAVGWWRGTGQWDRAAALARQFLADNPKDADLPRLRLGIAQDAMAFAAQPVSGKPTKQEMLGETAQRFNVARGELAKIIADFPTENALRQDAQWQIATSFLTQARVVDSFSPTLARGQYARAARELQRVAVEYADNPQIKNVPQMLASVAQELAARGYYEEAISTWNDLAINYPTEPLAQTAMVSVAQTYQTAMGRPLRAAEIYLEINFSRGGNDVEIQNAVFAIGAQLKNEKRWVEALHVLQTFVDGFPHHASAGQALTMIGQIHQANEAWDEAIAAYRRVINEYPGAGEWALDAKWSIAECIINLSRWPEAIGAYQSFVAAFPKDAKVAEANRRIGVLKDLANYQKLVDEKGPKAFDAQFQMASIIQKDLADPYKAIVEYRKVATDWPKSHLADDALYAIGLIYLQLGEVEQGRFNLEQVAALYPDSPLADDAMVAVGKSYEDEAAKYATITRDVQIVSNGEIAQKDAYRWASANRSFQRAGNENKVQELRKGGKKEAADRQEAANAADNFAFDSANTYLAAQQAAQAVEVLTAAQLADRQDKINAAIRKAVAAYTAASKIPGADKAGEALLRVAVLQGDRLNEPAAAMATWVEIVRQFSGTSVAEEASWRIAQNYEKEGKYAEAAEAYKAFLRNYRRSPRAQEAQYGIAENYEHLGQWVSAMDQYSNYVTNFPEGPLAQKAREQINFIKTYRL
ncbi:MAG TPA: tetratricopeptide repeat protein [Tepidisphaeraceae bacterium]|nr:tetratricopeptide repeat protein [Tepidisphaeraceae bacterium]